MKPLLFFILLLSTPFVFSQDEEEDLMENFMEEVIPVFIEKDIDGILNATHYPLSVKMGEEPFTEFKKSTWKKEMDSILTDGVISELRLMKPRDIQTVEYEPGEITFMLVCLAAKEGFEATVLSFKRIEGTWKLTNLNVQGE